MKGLDYIDRQVAMHILHATQNYTFWFKRVKKGGAQLAR